jgi:hypothetical protein
MTIEGIICEVGHDESDRILQTSGLEDEARMDIRRSTGKGNHVPREQLGGAGEIMSSVQPQ